jgi:plastocyanin
MKTLLTPKILIVVAVVVSIGAFFGGLAIVHHSSAQSASSQEGTVVLLRDSKAVPDTVTVKVGQTVQFNSADGKSHDIASGPGGHEHEHTAGIRSGKFSADEGWKVTFSKPGTYYFHDHLNPEISILVVAYNPSNGR